MLTAEEIKAVVSVEQVLSTMYGLDVRARMKCPIHGGEHNNFSIQDGFYNCFTCGASGDIFSLVENLSSTDFKGAKSLICEAFGLDVGNKSKEEKKALRIKIERIKKVQLEKKALKKKRRYQCDRICQVLREIRTLDGDSFLERHLEGLLRQFDKKEAFFIQHNIHAHLKAIWTKYQATQGALSTGDYSLTGLEHLIAIERKSLDDLASTLSAGRERFTREAERGRGLEYFALVVEASLEDIKAHNYKSKMTPHSLLQSLASFSVKYGLHVHYCGSRDGGEYMTFSLLEKFLIAKQRQLESILKHEAGEVNHE